MDVAEHAENVAIRSEPPASSEALLGSSMGQFELLEVEREEVLATVFSARHVTLGRGVTLKVLRAELAASPEAAARFFAEARVTSRIANAHVPAVLDIGDAGARPYYVTERVAGRSLEELLRTSVRVPLERALHIARGIGEALAAAHDVGIIHRDVRPSHVALVSRHADPDHVKLLGFGQPPPDADEVAYLSPEQCCSADVCVDARADQYALGAVLYHMLAGRPPLPSASRGETLLAHLTQKVPSLRQHAPDVSRAIEDVVERALRADPAARFGSIGELLDALAAAALPVSTDDFVDELEPRSSPRGARHTTALAIGTALAISILGVALVWSRAHREVPPVRISTTRAVDPAPGATPSLVAPITPLTKGSERTMNPPKPPTKPATPRVSKNASMRPATGRSTPKHASIPLLGYPE